MVRSRSLPIKLRAQLPIIPPWFTLLGFIVVICLSERKVRVWSLPPEYRLVD
jgi:hypothetical protein